MAIFAIGKDVYDTLKAARHAARERNKVAPETEIAIKRDGVVQEIWVGPVTFKPAGEGHYIAYSDADFDTIGAVRIVGAVFVAASRGADVGTFLNLFEVAHALHDFARGPAYRLA